MRTSAPIVRRFGVGAVDFVERTRIASLQIEQPQIRLVMPNRETSIIRHREHYVLAVIRGLCKSAIFVDGDGVKQRVNFARKMSVLKGDFAKVVLHFFVIFGNVVSLRLAEIQPLAVRGNAG